MASDPQTLSEVAARIDRESLRRLLVDRFGVGVGFASLGRIAVFAVVWLLLLGLVLPTPPPDTESLFVNRVDPTPDDIARSVTLDRRDERGFAPTNPTSALRVAWIGGSTLQELPDDADFRFIPGLMADGIRLEDGGKVDVDVYFLEATRVVDTYVATLEAIASEPDVLIVALNPVLVLNGAAVQTWDNLDGLLAARAVADPGTLSLAAPLVSPSDVAWGLVGRHFDVVEGRWHWSDRLNDRPTIGGLLDPAPPRPDESVGALEEVAAMSLPIDFWIAHGDSTHDGSKLGRQLALFAASTEYSDSINERVLELLGDAIVGSEIPTIVYVPPVQGDVAGEPWLARRLAEVISRLEKLRGGFDGPLVRYSAQPLDIPPDELQHVDLLHVRNGAAVADLIAERLCDLLDDVGGVTCEKEATS